MSRSKSVFFCQNCGHESPKWLGRCPSCGSWNTFVEEIVSKKPGRSGWAPAPGRGTRPIRIDEIREQKQRWTDTHSIELNRVLGGGLVPGSLVLIGGEPGIGKSTLMLQMALAMNPMSVLYVSGEESEQQIRMRADRMEPRPVGATGDANVYVLTETNTINIFNAMESLSPGLVIVDSVQTLISGELDSAPGSIAQVRQCTAEMLRFAKETNTPVFLVGHITKDGTLAGPKVLEHMVDTVLQFEGDRHLAYRILRTTKNRFGSTSEIGIYEMHATGLREVNNPSEILISQKDDALSGATIGATIEGNRPLLIEIQSLVSPSTYGTAQRTPTGFDPKRLNMLLAVLEKRGGLRMGQHDVFVNMAGGIRVEDPAIDLAVCASIASSLEDAAVSAKTCFAAEVGLGGELRTVNRIDQRISEAEKLGFEKIYISKYGRKSVNLDRTRIEVRALGKMTDVLTELF